MTRCSLYYTLDDELRPVQCVEDDTYFDWLAKMPDQSGWYRQKTGIGFSVAVDEVGDERVSTVYLGLDHGFGMNGDEGPILWESMVFPDCDVCERYRSHAEAIEGHRCLVEEVRSGVANRP
jgi:hypothetical protein